MPPTNRRARCGVAARLCPSHDLSLIVSSQLCVCVMQQSMDHMQPKLQGTSSRILYDIPCKVCQDNSSGKHYGIFACDGCAGFFKRSIRRNRQYVCKAKCEGSCVVDKTHRNQCRACRLRKCVQAGMNKDAVQHERGPRNSTLRRQVAMFFKDAEAGALALPTSAPSVLDLALPKVSSSTASPPRPSPPAHLLPPPSPYFYTTPLPKEPCSLPPPLMFNSPESISEYAARILFMTVTWIKSVPAFTYLALKDQLLLLEESWRELFVLGAAEYFPPLNLTCLLRDSQDLAHEVTIFQESIVKLRGLHLDATEYNLLRAIVLFKTGTLCDVTSVASFRDQTQVTLDHYVSNRYPSQPHRFGKLLLLLPSLQAVSSDTIEELFFRRTIGEIPIVRLLCDMYKTSFERSYPYIPLHLSPPSQ
ncbi:nuclear receptor subfamily 2 group E member 1-like [Macrosteles quadrilineatus]|uniref:nuclear receptor subfamily 2 group E member 1-like n=1 Tax=Macrosteles quadrilineatus TaxID=74068 RepID=UPI0023E2AEF3|nr:nuclear receptor subfamily 2 group E member 1-like [Macrosteles quadrilineatus]